MIQDVSLPLITQAAIPGLGLAAIGLAWLFWGKPIKAIPATLFSLGVAFLALMALTVLVYITPLLNALEEAMLMVLGLTSFVYAASLFICMRRFQVPAISTAVVGMLGLVPLWHLGGFVLMNSVCSFGTGGC